MNLEQYISRLNSLTFWREFTFSKNKFSPEPGNEFELADNFIWLGDHAIALQLKQRESETSDPKQEETWFRKKVLDKATRQIRDTIRFLGQYDNISITNEHGHTFEIPNIKETTNIIVYIGGRCLPDDCTKKRYHISKSAGFIHILPANDYLGIIEKLRVPCDIRRYFAYREEVIQKLEDLSLEEVDIMGAFLRDEEVPTTLSRRALAQFIQDFESFDISRLLRDLYRHIENSEDPYGYYQILLEFARMPRSVWREVKLRFDKCVDATKAKEFIQPFRFSYPAIDCTIMIASLDPEMPSTGEEGEKLRISGLQNLTDAATYDRRTTKGIGILVSKDGEYFQIDWTLINIPWEPNPMMDEILAKNYPFRKASERIAKSFLFEE